jgi:hypothetical protein
LNDGHEVVGELLVDFAVLVGVEDCEFGAAEAEDGLDEFESKAGKTVSMGHDNFADA